MTSGGKRFSASGEENDGAGSTNQHKGNQKPPQKPPIPSIGSFRKSNVQPSENDEEPTFDQISDDLTTISGMIVNIQSKSQLASQNHHQLLLRHMAQGKELESSKQEVARLQMRIGEVENHLSDNEKASFAVSQKNQELQNQLDVSEERATRSSQSLSDANRENEELNREVHQLRERLRDSEKSRKILETARNEEDLKFEKKNVVIKERIRSLRTENEILKIKMRKLEESHQSSLNDAVALIHLNESLGSAGDVVQNPENIVEMEEFELVEDVDASQFASSFDELINTPEALQCDRNGAMQENEKSVEMETGIEENRGEDDVRNSQPEKNDPTTVEPLQLQSPIVQLETEIRTTPGAHACASKENAVDPNPAPSSSATFHSALQSGPPSLSKPPPLVRIASEEAANESLVFWNLPFIDLDSEQSPTPEEQTSINDFRDAFHKAVWKADHENEENRRASTSQVITARHSATSDTQERATGTLTSNTGSASRSIGNVSKAAEEVREEIRRRKRKK